MEHIENIEKRYNKKKKEVKENIKSISNKDPKENIELESNEELKENTEQKSNEESKNNINQNGDTDKIQDESEKICPRCGGKLVLRIAKKGENTGKQFYGCERFPKCRYIENIELLYASTEYLTKFNTDAGYILSQIMLKQKENKALTKLQSLLLVKIFLFFQ